MGTQEEKGQKGTTGEPKGPKSPGARAVPHWASASWSRGSGLAFASVPSSDASFRGVVACWGVRENPKPQTLPLNPQIAQTPKTLKPKPQFLHA